MSTMSEKRPKRSRRSFTDDFKAGAVRLVLDEGRTVAAAARDLGLTESSLRNWVDQARADRTKGKTGLTTEERAELATLRKDNRELRMERDILKKAAAFFAPEPSVVFTWIEAEKAEFPITNSVGICRSRPAASTRRGLGRSRLTRRPTDACASWCVPRSTKAGSGTAARAFTRI
jgi:transposase